MLKALPMLFQARFASKRLCMFMIGMLTAFSSFATNFVVSSLANTGAGTLRAAITAANADNSGPHTITFSVSGVINVTTSLPAIIKPITIDGGNTITISGPGADNHIGLIVLGAGSSGSTIRNMLLRNTGLEPVLLTAALSNITLEKLTTYQTGTHYANHAVLANAAVTGLKIIDMTVTGVQDNWYGLRFNSTVTDLTIDGFRVSGGGGLKARGMHFGGAVNGAIIKNCLVDMDDPATADDGDYGIVFNSNVNNLTIDSSTFRDAEVNSILFTGNSTISNVTVKNTLFDNLDGGIAVQMIRFETTTNVNTFLAEKNTFNADMRNTADDGEYAIVIGCNNTQNVQILSNTFTEHDGSGIHIGSNSTNNTDNLTIRGNTFTRNGRGLLATGGMRIYVRNATADADSVRITENVFNANNGNAIGVFAGSNVQSTVQKFVIKRNTIYSTQSAVGGIYVQYVNKVVISENSIYNNVGKGIELGTGGNCAYEGVNTPTILSSTEITPGVYTLTVKMPTICGTGNCSLEVFSNGAKVTGTGGQHYVTTRAGLASGNQTIMGVTGAFPEINGAPYGTWSATLKVNNNCGTSEFSNKLRVKIVGPAGVNSGIKLWLRGDELLAGGTTPASSGQLISGWDELSGGGGPSATTIINNPLTKLNGINFNPVADMDGDIIRGVLSGATSWISNNALTTVAVMNPLSITASNDRLFVLFSQSGVDYNTNHAQIEFFRTGNNIQSYRGNTLLNPPIAGTTGVSALNKPGIFTSYTTPTAHSAYYNGLGQGSGAYNKGNFAISQWFVGGGWGPNPSGSGGNTWYYAGETDFAEVFTYNRNLTAAELQQVHSYMALKYGIALKQPYMLSNSTVIWDVVANAAYSKEVAALVRDDLSILEQKQAKAFQADEVATISLGSVIAPTNNENDGVISNDLSVLIWGNDSASTAFTQPFTGAKANTRMVRKWKVQKTNWADQEITVKLNNGREGHYLLISTDPTFATVSEELPLNNDGTVTINSSLLANNVYFTFGREQKSPGGVLTSLDVWVKADEGVELAGNNTMSWEDQGPSMRLWGKVGTSVLPYIPAGFNYNPAVTFIGPTNSYFSVAPFTSTYTQGEVFSVQSSTVNTVAGFPFQLGGSSGTTTVFYRFTDHNMYLHWGTNARRQFLFGSTKNMAVPVILNLNTAANSWTASLDGKIISGPVAYPTSFAQTGTNNAIGVGYGSYFNGPISEVIQYKRKLNATERAQVNSYMALKYGITQDQTTATNYIASDGITTMWSAADNGTYKFNIAGIGRDDKGTLLQKQSRSINTTGSGNLISVAVGSELAASNAANSDTITNDKSFLTWADNNGAVTYTTNVVGGDKVTLRMARVWKVDKTNWADRNITIKLHGSASNTYLLISNTDATFATLDQELPVNADSTITINSDLLPDGAYFTFAKEMKGPGFVNSGVQFWLRADDGTSTPAEWNDYSGNDNSAAQSGTTSQPLFRSSAANFNPGFFLDGSNDYMDFSTNAGISGSNLFTVLSVSTRATAANDVVLGQPSSANNSFGSGYINAKYFVTSTNIGSVTSTGNYTVLNMPMLHNTTRSAGNLFNLYTNGAADGSGTQAFTFLTSNLRLGWRGGTTADQYHGDINEVIVYNRALNAAELLQANSYLALKYGITLASGTTDYIATDGTTRMWTVTKNGTFNKNIAGIGRDEKTGLFQKQSRSASDTTVIIAAGTTIAADNASNTSDFDDLSFFTWADNAGTTTFSVAVTSVTNATSRMARVWKVDRTNWVDQDITIKVTPGGERYLLVHATDPAFGAGAAEHQINTMTGTVTLNTADLPDGAYFTIGTKIAGPGCVNNGIATWLRADYAAGVDSWIDFSGNQTNAAQTNGGLQPDYNAFLNYNPAFTFNGTNDNLIIPNAAIAGKYSFGAAQRTVIGVGATAKATGYGMMFAYGGNTAGVGLYLGQGLGTSNAGFGGYNSAAYNIEGTANSLPLNNTRIIGGRYNGTAAFLDVNGNQNATLATTWNTNATAPAYIGVGSTVTSQYWNGKVGEVIVYNRVLTADELKRVNSYLAIKYGVTLDQTTATDYIASDGTTIMWNAADNTGFNLRITGIGRDDCTNLYQKQSISANAGILAAGVGDSIATTNQANTAEITNDNSYFVFGDDNGAITYTTPVSGLANVTTRMPRIWKVDKTNFADANIAFKLTGGNDKVYLIVSTDNTFDGADATYQMEANGSVQLSSAEIPDGAYFTFGKQLNGPGYVNIGVALWLRADDNVSTSETWLDYSGNGNDANQSNGMLQPAFTDGTTNYNPGFVFSGAQQMSLDVNKFPLGNAARTLIGVGTPNNVTGARYMFGWGTAVQYQYNSLVNVANAMTYSGYTSDIAGPAGSAAIGVPQEMMGTWTGGTGTASLYSKMKLLNSAARTWNTGTTGGAYIGMVSNNSQFWSGSITELIVYNRAIADYERHRISSYLALKYGYTLDQTTPTNYVATDWDGSTGTIYWNATANAAYNKNIAGIGRDDKTGLYQKQSRSVNTASFGNMVAMGLNTIEATNKDNTSTIDDDMNFLVWGDNGLTGIQVIEYPLELNPGGCSRITRLQREWKVQKTGTVNGLQLQMNLASQVPSSTAAGDIKLLIDTDGDFGNGGTTIIDVSSYDAATQTVTFDNISFSDGDYFTLVTDLTNQAPGGVTGNLLTWHRADKGINATGTVVNGWLDQGGFTKDLLPAIIGTSNPAYNTTTGLINFNPVLTYDGTSDVMSNGTISNHTAATNGEDIFAVVLPNAVAAQSDIVGLGTVANTATATELRMDANRLQYLANNGAVASVTSPATSNGIVQLANGNRSGTGAASLLMNGNVVATGTMAQYPNTTQLNIGARRAAAANNFFFNGKIAEVAIYNKQLSNEERMKVASYLAIKYGITLSHDYVDPANTVVWSLTGNTGYNYNITGIGRDDCNGLHQKQSKSVNANEALVTLGHGLGINATNATNTNIMENVTAMLLGDDNGLRNAFTATGAPSGRERIARTWKVQETGTIGTVTIQVPANSSAAAVKLPLERDGVVYMLVNNSNNFTTGATEVPMTLNGDNWETTYDFSSGDYFTFATNDACVTTQAILTNYNAETIAATDKCYVNGWILFKSPTDASKFIAAIYDPSGLIDRALITAKVDVDAAFSDLGKGAGTQAARLMRRLLQIDCASCFDAGANPTPGFIVRMFYTPDEKAGAESVETNNITDIKAANSITDPHTFKWFKAAGKTAAEVVSGLTAAGGIEANGQEWADGVLPTGQADGVDYIDFTGINSFSTFGGIWIVNLQNALPVTWQNVQATPADDRTILVKWSTASEQNNAGFDVERSDDATNFTSIAKVGSRGNSNTVSNYSYNDNNVLPGVKYYYRIRQTDNDGRTGYSKIVSASLDAQGGFYMRIAQNPVRNQLYVEVVIDKQQKLQTFITDVSGKMLGSRVVTAQQGKSTITSDVMALKDGVYFIRVVTADGKSQTLKFTIQKGK